LLIADSWIGALMRVDLAAREISVWFKHEQLTRAPGLYMLPGANGVKRFGDRIFVSSTGRALLLSVAVNENGSAGQLELLSERLRADDMAFDVLGNAYLSTHIGHSLDRFARDGTRVSLAGPDQGMAGSTACAFGRAKDDSQSLYVTTTGGIILPAGGVLQPAKLIRLEIGVTGHSLSNAWETC